MIKPSKWKTTYKGAKGLLQASIDGDVEAYRKAESEIRMWYNIENGLPMDEPYRPKNSPMAQFDASHEKWVSNGREC